MRFLLTLMLVTLFAVPAMAQEEGEGLSVQVDREVERATGTSPQVPSTDPESKAIERAEGRGTRNLAPANGDGDVVASSYENHKIETGDYEGVVTKVLDADKIEIDGERFRLLGVNAPEYEGNDNDCYALESTQRLEAKIQGKMVTYSFDRGYGRRDRHGDARIYLYHDGVNINAWLIENGLAFVDPSKTYHMQEEFVPLQADARRKHLGIWHACPVECNRAGICRTRNW